MGKLCSTFVQILGFVRCGVGWLLNCGPAVFVDSDHYVVTFVGDLGCLNKYMCILVVYIYTKPFVVYGWSR